MREMTTTIAKMKERKTRRKHGNRAKGGKKSTRATPFSLRLWKLFASGAAYGTMLNPINCVILVPAENLRKHTHTHTPPAQETKSVCAHEQQIVSAQSSTYHFQFRFRSIKWIQTLFQRSPVRCSRNFHYGFFCRCRQFFSSTVLFGAIILQRSKTFPCTSCPLFCCVAKRKSRRPTLENATRPKEQMLSSWRHVSIPCGHS